MPALIVMPSDAPRSKIARTREWGAEIRFYDRDREDRETIAQALAAERGATLVPSYDDPLIIAGQGTVGREIAEDLQTLGAGADVVVVNASGGGLAAGVGLAVSARMPGTRLLTAEPAGFDDHARSFRAGRRLENERSSGSICDALLARMPGRFTFAITRALFEGGVSASDREVEAAVAFAFRELKLVTEPGGAVGLAALMAGRPNIEGRTAVVILSGGNIDAGLFARLISDVS